MSKKLMTGLLALVALAAMALPAAASASPELTAPTGTTAATGTKIQATNVGVTKFIASGLTVECSIDKLTGTLTKNNGTEIDETIESASFKGTSGTGEECSSPYGAFNMTTNVGNGTPWCLRALQSFANADEFQIRGNSCTNAPRGLTFVMDFPEMSCQYQRTTTTGLIKGGFATDPEDAILTITLANSQFVGETGNPPLCPGSFALETKFTMETDPTAGSTSPFYLS